jgi:hypothetical protein
LYKYICKKGINSREGEGSLCNNNIVQTTEKSMIPDKETIIMIPTVENSMTQDKENCQVYIKQGSLFPPI